MELIVLGSGTAIPRPHRSPAGYAVQVGQETLLFDSGPGTLGRLAQAGLEDLEAHIRAEASFVPTDWQDRYNLTLGSAHGLSHKLTQMGYLRPHNRHPRFHNLYFVGASTHPGTGIPSVLVSSRLVTERILGDIGDHPLSGG